MKSKNQKINSNKSYKSMIKIKNNITKLSRKHFTTIAPFFLFLFVEIVILEYIIFGVIIKGY